jgi:hypothetical protein
MVSRVQLTTSLVNGRFDLREDVQNAPALACCVGAAFALRSSQLLGFWPSLEQADLGAC